MAEREYYGEINALVASIAKAHGIGDKQAIGELESGAIALSMGVDGNGEHYVSVARKDIEVHLYQGAIRYTPDVEPPPAKTPEAGT